MNPVRIPDDTRALHNIGEFIMSYDAHQNAFLNALVNRIGRVIVTSQMWENPWAVFKKGKLEYGETVEEIFANIANPHSFDPSVAEREVFKREIPDVRAAFHTMNFQKFYKVSVQNDMLRQAFLSFGEMSDLIARIVDTLYTGMRLDEYLTMKYMVCREALNGGIYPVLVEDIDTDPEDAVRKFREYTNNLTFLKSTYNRAGVRNSTPVANQVIIVPNYAESVIGVDVLANAFNINQVDYIGNRIAVDSFTFDSDDLERLDMLFANDPAYTQFTQEEQQTLASIVALKLDRDWFMVFDNFEQFTENYNGQGLYWQYFYHVWKTFSASPFANAILFTSTPSEVTGITVSPSEANVAQGTSIQMTATAEGTGMYEKGVVWSIRGANDSETNINPLNGVLHVGVHEPINTQILAIASTSDSGSTLVTGQATITVTARQ